MSTVARAEVIRNRSCVEIDTIRRLFSSGQKNVFEKGYRAITPNFVQGDISCERITQLPNRKGALRVDFEIAVMSDLLRSVFLEVDVPPIEVEGHKSVVTMTLDNVTSTGDISLRAVRISDGYSAVLGSFSDPAFYSARYTAANGISFVPILSQIAQALRSTTDPVFANEFDVKETLDDVSVGASFGFRLKFESQSMFVYNFLAVNGVGAHGGAGFAGVPSITGRVKPTEFATWAWGLGFAMIERFEVILNNQTIETVYGDYLHFHEELHGKPGKSLEAACFRYKGITLPEMGALSKRGFTMHVPIPTFFSASEGAAPLPIQKMRGCNQEMKFRVYLRPLEELSLSLPDLSPTTFDRITPNTSGVSFGGGASTEFNPGSNIFDGSVISDYVIYHSTGGPPPSESNPYYLTYDHGSEVVLNRYRLFRNTGDWPKSWYLEGSNDNSNFVTIDQTFRGSNFTEQPQYIGTDPEDNLDEAHEAIFNPEDTAYRYYRWAFTSTSDTAANYQVKIKELELFSADRSVARSAPVVANTWSDFGMNVWMGMTMMTGADARQLEELNTSHVVKLVEPLHKPETEGHAFQGNEMRLDLRLRHPTTQIMWAIADDARLEKTPKQGSLRPFTEGIGSLVGPFCDAEDMNVLREGHKKLSSGSLTSADVQTTPRMIIPGNRFEYRGSDGNGKQVEPLEYVMLQLNRENRLEETIPPEYYRMVTPFSSRRIPLDDQRIYTYAFTPWASDPHRLSLGSFHFGRLHEKLLQVRTRTRSSKPVRFVGFAETYNVFLCDKKTFAMKYV